MFMSANSITTPNSSARTSIFVTNSASFSAVVISDIVYVTPVLVTRWVHVDTLRVWIRFHFLISCVVCLFVVSAVVSHSGFRKFRVTAIVPQITIVVVPGEPDKALISPAFPPGVLHQDVQRGVAYCCNCVVRPAIARRVFEDSAGVRVESVSHFRPRPGNPLQEPQRLLLHFSVLVRFL